MELYIVLPNNKKRRVKSAFFCNILEGGKKQLVVTPIG